MTGSSEGDTPDGLRLVFEGDFDRPTLDAEAAAFGPALDATGAPA